MTAPVISLEAYRRSRKIVQVIPVVHSDVRLEFAQRVEQRMYEIEMQDVAKWLKVVDFMRGCDATPSNSPGDAA